eukprot:gnl/TRDRNA2_/TRDRNA2_94749_c0_seq2.p1 gnl/TRDRNA2_/TRDRNA2_94749_c0~~gnl/TRDRNA2_/TRDRNA2_94749_c0_seq2.p1  ORF type:complete len:369 (+),score=48.35 gnl/TRDRNA2_/TRDRNA2_94749_c0_seq2:51-1109(+)
MLDLDDILVEPLLHRAIPRSLGCHAKGLAFLFLINCVSMGVLLAFAHSPFHRLLVQKPADAMSDAEAVRSKLQVARINPKTPAHHPAEPMRIDPADGVVYSFDELYEAYKGNKSAEEVEFYWDKECRPAKFLSGTLVEVKGVHKLDPADEHRGFLKPHTFGEIVKKYKEHLSKDELKAYWDEECSAVKLLERPADYLQFRAVFMDQKGSRYQDDLQVLEEQGLLIPGAVVIADNVLKPGAPLFLWRITKSGAYDTEIVSLKEFAMPAEDWMAVTRLKSDKPPVVPPAPAEVTQLAWESDRIRDKATRSDGGVTYGEWAAFAQDFKQRLKPFGIQATTDAASYVGSTTTPPPR